MKKAKWFVLGATLFLIIGALIAFKSYCGLQGQFLYIGTSTLCTLRVINATTSYTGLRYFISDEATTICPISTFTTTIDD